jgi:hypothetical protein
MPSSRDILFSHGDGNLKYVVAATFRWGGTGYLVGSSKVPEEKWLSAAQAKSASLRRAFGGVGVRS